MMLPLGITRDLGADHARGVRILLRAMHPADARRAEALDLQRAGRWTIVRTGAVDDLGLGVGNGV